MVSLRLTGTCLSQVFPKTPFRTSGKEFLFFWLLHPSSPLVHRKYPYILCPERPLGVKANLKALALLGSVTNSQSFLIQMSQTESSPTVYALSTLVGGRVISLTALSKNYLSQNPFPSPYSDCILQSCSERIKVREPVLKYFLCKFYSLVLDFSAQICFVSVSHLKRQF